MIADDARLTPELKLRLADPMWRLENLYTIVDDNAQEMPFVPNEEQRTLARRLHNSNLVLKARQLGITTWGCVGALDQCIFNPNFAASIIAHSLNDSSRIFRDKVRRVYERLPRLVRELAPVESDTSTGLVFANGSAISVGTSARSGTVQWLHVSEMGKIARKYPEKAAEIVSGAFEAVPINAIKIVESTAEGRAGWFYEAVMEAMRRRQQGKRLTPLDFRLHFFPWHTKASYRVDPSLVIIPDEMRRYFDELRAKHGIQLDAAQQAWYTVKRGILKDLMWREHPSFEEEAFAASVEGMIYADEMKLLRLMGRVGVAAIRTDLPVNTFWDFGVNDHNSIWLHQRVGAMNRFVRFYQNQNEGLAHYWQWLEGWRQQTGTRWGKHYLPHDADTRIQGSSVFTKRQVLEELGMRPDSIVVVPRTPSVTDAITLTKRILPDCEFDEAGCAEGIDALDNYSKVWDDNVGDWKPEPRDDVYSHGADAFRQFAQSWATGQETQDLGRGVQSMMPATFPRGGY